MVTVNAALERRPILEVDRRGTNVARKATVLKSLVLHVLIASLHARSPRTRSTRTYMDSHSAGPDSYFKSLGLYAKRSSQLRTLPLELPLWILKMGSILGVDMF